MTSVTSDDLSRSIRFRLLFVVAMLAGTFVIPPASRAALRAGCVGSDDIGTPGMIGWTDAGLLFQTDPAEAPHRLQIVGLDGVSVLYLDGIGLRLPTEESPFWLATVHEDGQYVLIVDGYDCAVTAIGTTPRAPKNLSRVLSSEVRLTRHPGVWFAFNWLHVLGATKTRTLD